LQVPLDGTTITDDTRIRAAVPTLKYLCDNGAKVVLTSHLGRPKSGPEDKFRLNPIVPRLSELLGKKVVKADDCIGEEVKSKLAGVSNGEVLLLENVRFYKEETKNDPEFAKKLAEVADIYVNDAFGTAHRAHASTEGVTKYLSPSVAGFLLQKELDYLDGAVSNPKRPFAAIVGGSKVSSKIGVIESLLEKCDKIIIGGGMVFTFYKARGLPVGSSLVEEDKLDLAKELEAKAKAKGVELVLPVDVIVADKFAPDAATQVVDVSAIPDGWMGLDIGPKSIDMINAALADCQTIIWNGAFVLCVCVFNRSSHDAGGGFWLFLACCTRIRVCTHIRRLSCTYYYDIVLMTHNYSIFFFSSNYTPKHVRSLSHPSKIFPSVSSCVLPQVPWACLSLMPSPRALSPLPTRLPRRPMPSPSSVAVTPWLRWRRPAWRIR
jgi:3-phosphoglycerate kinase